MIDGSWAYSFCTLLILWPPILVTLQKNNHSVRGIRPQPWLEQSLEDEPIPGPLASQCRRPRQAFMSQSPAATLPIGFFEFGDILWEPWGVRFFSSATSTAAVSRMSPSRVLCPWHQAESEQESDIRPQNYCSDSFLSPGQANRPQFHWTPLHRATQGPRAARSFLHWWKLSVHSPIAFVL